MTDAVKAGLGGPNRLPTFVLAEYAYNVSRLIFITSFSAQHCAKFCFEGLLPMQYMTHTHAHTHIHTQRQTHAHTNTHTHMSQLHDPAQLHTMYKFAW